MTVRRDALPVRVALSQLGATATSPQRSSLAAFILPGSLFLGQALAPVFIYFQMAQKAI